MKGFAGAAPGIGDHLRAIAATGLNNEAMLQRLRLRTVFTAPGLVLADPLGLRPSPESLRMAGYGERPETVSIPLHRNITDESLYRLTERLYRPTRLEPMHAPEDILANTLAAAIMRAILENRYTLAAYAAADTLAGGGPITVLGPVRSPLLTPSGVTAHAEKALDIVEQLFKTAGHRVKRAFLTKYFAKIISIIKVGEELAGRRLVSYDLRDFYEAAGGELLAKLRGDIASMERGGEPEHANELLEKKTSPFNILEELHAYLSQTPYLTAKQVRLLENLTISATALSSTLPKLQDRRYVDKVDYMVMKRKMSWEISRILTSNLAPVQAYTPKSGPTGIDRLAWAIMLTYPT
jgi:hypothetical protein